MQDISLSASIHRIIKDKVMAQKKSRRNGYKDLGELREWFIEDCGLRSFWDDYCQSGETPDISEIIKKKDQSISLSKSVIFHLLSAMRDLNELNGI